MFRKEGRHLRNAKKITTREATSAPDSGELIKLILNIETQKEFTPGYPLVKRGIYYAARLISAQKNTEFVRDNYDDIKKVYSIWICQNVPTERKHTIVQYSIHEDIILGNSEEIRERKRNYDIFTVLLLGLGDIDRDTSNSALQMLSVALSKKINTDKKKQWLSEEFGIAMTEKVERTIKNMGSLGYGIAYEALEKGIEQGRLEGKQNNQMEVAKRMIALNKNSDEEIALCTGLPVETISQMRS